MKRLQQIITAGLTVFILTLMYLQSPAQNCDAILAQGIFNTTTIKNNADFEQAFNEYIYDANFSTHQQAIDAGFSIGIPIYEIPLELNGQFSSQQRDEWKSTHQQYKNDKLSISQKYQALIKFASPDIVEAWKTCITTAPHVGLYGWIQDVGGASALLHVTWIPMAGDTGDPPKITGSSIIGGYRSDNPAAPVMPPDYLLLPGANGNLVGIVRKMNEDLIVIVNTTRGDIACFLKVPPKPAIAAFAADRTTINHGESVRLSWAVNNAAEIKINQGVGAVQQQGSLLVSPVSNTSYKLTASSSSGMVSSMVTVAVNPPPPVLTGASVTFHTTDDDKDGDTRVTIYVKEGGNTVAQWSGTEGHWNDHSDHGPYGLSIINAIRKEQLLGSGQAVLVEGPNGHDEWHGQFSITLSFSDSTSKRYDYSFNVDHDRTTSSYPLP